VLDSLDRADAAIVTVRPLEIAEIELDEAVSAGLTRGSKQP
jgi:hypothetical protein